MTEDISIQNVTLLSMLFTPIKYLHVEYLAFLVSWGTDEFLVSHWVYGEYLYDNMSKEWFLWIYSHLLKLGMSMAWGYMRGLLGL